MKSVRSILLAAALLFCALFLMDTPAIAATAPTLTGHAVSSLVAHGYGTVMTIQHVNSQYWDNVPSYAAFNRASRSTTSIRQVCSVRRDLGRIDNVRRHDAYRRVLTRSTG